VRPVDPPSPHLTSREGSLPAKTRCSTPAPTVPGPAVRADRRADGRQMLLNRMHPLGASRGAIARLLRRGVSVARRRFFFALHPLLDDFQQPLARLGSRADLLECFYPAVPYFEQGFRLSAEPMKRAARRSVPAMEELSVSTRNTTPVCAFTRWASASTSSNDAPASAARAAASTW